MTMLPLPVVMAAFVLGDLTPSHMILPLPTSLTDSVGVAAVMNASIVASPSLFISER